MVAVLHNIRSVHNVGSIFRTADAVGIKKLYLCGITPTPIDRFGKKRNDFVKVSLGSEETVLWEKCEDTIEIINKLKSDGYLIISLEQSDKSIPYSKKIDIKKEIALIVGDEVNGLSQSILDASDYIIEIPMNGKKESLNVSVSFGIAAYELKKSIE